MVDVVQVNDTNAFHAVGVTLLYGLVCRLIRSVTKTVRLKYLSTSLLNSAAITCFANLSKMVGMSKGRILPLPMGMSTWRTGLGEQLPLDILFHNGFR